MIVKHFYAFVTSPESKPSGTDDSSNEPNIEKKDNSTSTDNTEERNQKVFDILLWTRSKQNYVYECIL
jgi:hypothetical protein